MVVTLGTDRHNDTATTQPGLNLRIVDLAVGDGSSQVPGFLLAKIRVQE